MADEMTKDELRWLALMAKGDCLCDEIDPADVPCMTCEAEDILVDQAVKKLQAQIVKLQAQIA